MRYLLFAFAALALVAEPCAAQAVEPGQAAASPYERIYDTLLAHADDGPAIEAGLDWMVTEVAKDPDVAALEAANPGLLDKMRVAFRPIFASYSQRLKLAYRPRMIAVFEGALTSAEAVEIAEFYATPIGHRLMSGVVQNYRPNAVLGTLETGQEVNAVSVKRDLDSATTGALRGLSADESAELYREFAARPALMKLAPIVPQLTALRAEMEQQPMAPEELAAIEDAAREVFASAERPALAPHRRK